MVWEEEGWRSVCKACEKKGVKEGIKTIVFESLPVKESGRECVHCTLSQR